VQKLGTAEESRGTRLPLVEVPDGTNLWDPAPDGKGGVDVEKPQNGTKSYKLLAEVFSSSIGIVSIWL
jgi:hypothetical protein